MIPLSVIVKSAKCQLVKKIKTGKTKKKINNIYINKCLKNNIKRGHKLGTKPHMPSQDTNKICTLLKKYKSNAFWSSPSLAK
jgi:hypothetical protein